MAVVVLCDRARARAPVASSVPSLTATTEADEVRRRHALRYVELAGDAESELIRTELRAWQRRLRADQDNLRLALQWLRETGDATRYQMMAGSLWRFWQYWAEVREGRRWLEVAAGMAPHQAADEARAVALSCLAWLLFTQGEVERAEVLHREVVEIRHSLGDGMAIAVALADSVWSGRHSRWASPQPRSVEARRLWPCSDSRMAKRPRPQRPPGLLPSRSWPPPMTLQRPLRRTRGRTRESAPRPDPLRSRVAGAYRPCGTARRTV